MNRIRNSREEFEYVSYLKATAYPALIHAWSCDKPLPSFLGCRPDGYCPRTKTLFNFYGCQIHFHESSPSAKCLLLPANATLDTCNAFGVPFKNMLHRRKVLTADILSRCSDQVHRVENMFQCTWRKLKSDTTSEVHRFMYLSMQEPKRLNLERLNCKQAVRGGRVDAFWTLAQADQHFRIDFFDISSLYPYIAISKKYCRGVGKIVVGHDIKRCLKWIDNRLYFRAPKNV